MKPRIETADYRIGECPACSHTLWASLAVVVELGPLAVGKDGATVAVDATPSIKGMAVSHRCGDAAELDAATEAAS